VRERVRACGGREVADRGDGFMVVFSEPRDGVDCAVSIQQALALYSCEHDARIEAHIGLHAGRPLQHQGQLYGTDVNLTARIADDVAQAGEILVSRHLRDLLPSEQGLAFDDGREVELKGLSGKHEVFGVLWREPTGATRLLSSALRPR
jgi:class 3 adenylate cyclase